MSDKVIEMAWSTLRHALSWMATPGEVQLRLMGESVYDPGRDLLDEAESAVLAGRLLSEQGALSVGTVSMLESLLQDVVVAIDADEEYVGREAVLSAPFWQDVRSRASSHLQQLRLKYIQPDPYLKIGPDGQFQQPVHGSRTGFQAFRIQEEDGN